MNIRSQNRSTVGIVKMHVISTVGIIKMHVI